MKNLINSLLGKVILSSSLLTGIASAEVIHVQIEPPNSHVAPGTVFYPPPQPHDSSEPGVLDVVGSILGKVAKKKRMIKSLVALGIDPEAAKAIANLPPKLQRAVLKDVLRAQLMRKVETQR